MTDLPSNTNRLQPYRPGILKLESCILVNYREQLLNISQVMVEFSVYHDIFAQGTKVEVLIEDSNGLIELFPIVGDESLLLRFSDNSDDGFTMSYAFRVYKIDNRTKNDSRTESYVLHGITPETISNHRKMISRSYKDMKASEVVETIYNEYLKPTAKEYGEITVQQSPSLDIQETKEKKAWVFPTQKPLEIIDYLCKEAEAKNDSKKGSNFLFYETHKDEKEWHFKTLDSLFQQKPFPKDTFYYAPSTVQARKSLNEDKTTVNSRLDPGPASEEKDATSVYAYQKIEKFNMIGQFDTLQNVRTGLYNNQIDAIDPIIKTFKSDVFLYEDDFGKLGHMQDQKFYTTGSLYRKKEPNTIKHYMVTNFDKEYQTTDYVKNGINKDNQIKYPRVAHKFLKYDIASRQQLNNIIIEITIPGNVELDIGTMIKIIVPQSSSFEEYSKQTNLLFNDGKFLITAMKHTYNKIQDKFFTTLECIRDTYAEDQVETDDPGFEG